MQKSKCALGFSHRSDDCPVPANRIIDPNLKWPSPIQLQACSLVSGDWLTAADMNRPANLQSSSLASLRHHVILQGWKHICCADASASSGVPGCGMHEPAARSQAISSLFQVIHVGYSLLHGSSRSLVRTNHFTSQETPREISRCGSSDAIPGPCSARHCFSLWHNRREWRMLLRSVAVL